MSLAIVHAHVITETGELPDTTVLIEDGVIVALTKNPPKTAEILDARGLTAIPGLVDGHRHTWQSPLRGIGADMTLPDYFQAVLGRALSRYRPEDTHTATLLGAAEALDVGITTVFDWNNTPHVDAAADAFTQAGIRAVVASETPGQDDGRVRHALAILGPEHGDWDESVKQLAQGRERGLTISFHAQGPCIEHLANAQLLGPDLNIVHLNAMTDSDAKALADSRTGVTITPLVEQVMGHGASPYGRFRRAGGRAGLGTDVVVNAPADLFEALRDTLRDERRHGMTPAGDLLPAATSDSARAIGAGGGTLAVGQPADIVLLDGLSHLGSRAGAVVTTVTSRNVRHVIVDGQPVKRDGRLVGLDLPALRAAAEEIAWRTTK